MRGRKLTKQQIQNIHSLREKGYSLSEIIQKLDLAKTTVYSYLKNVSVLPEYRALLKVKRGTSKKVKQLKEQKALEEASIMIKDLSNKEKLLFIAALYWAEGSKKDFGLSNTDPNLISVFVNGLREVLHIPDERLRISIRIYEDLNKEECLQFWSKIVNIPQEKFVSINILPGKKKGKLLYGMCRVRVTKGELFLKKIKAINSIVSQNLSL